MEEKERSEDMASDKMLNGAAHNIMAHAVSGLSFFTFVSSRN